MKNFVSLILVFLFCSCTTTMPDRVNKLRDFEVSSKKLFIKQFDFDPSIAMNVDKNFVRNFGQEIALDIADLFQKENKQIDARLKGNEEDCDFLIRGKITQVEGGSMHARVWLGFGYGASFVSVNGELMNLKTTESVMRFSLTKRSNWTWSNSETAVRENLNEVAQEIVNSILEKRN